jgi:molybdopterin/thiamine biosynthesis adenylyltransferase
MARLARQSFLGENSEHTLAGSRIAIIGLGGGGSHVAQQLAHVGVGEFVLLDPDVVEETNLNRLVGATVADVSRKTPKVDVAARLITGVNPGARITKRQATWQGHAVLLRECTAIIGCVDSFSEREQLDIAARRYLVPYIDIGMDVHAVGEEFFITGQVVLSAPGERCLRCLGIITDDALAREAQRYGDAGARAQVIWPNAILASTAVGLVMQLVTPWHAKPVVSAYLEYDGNRHTLAVSNRWIATEGRECKHHININDIGDPFWTPTTSAVPKPSWISRVRRALLRH